MFILAYHINYRYNKHQIIINVNVATENHGILSALEKGHLLFMIGG